MVSRLYAYTRSLWEQVETRLRRWTWAEARRRSPPRISLAPPTPSLPLGGQGAPQRAEGGPAPLTHLLAPGFAQDPHPVAVRELAKIIPGVAAVTKRLHKFG